MLPGFISVDVCAPGRIKAHCTVLISDTDYFLALYERLRCQIQYQCFCVFNFNIFPVLLTCKKIKVNLFRFLEKSSQFSVTKDLHVKNIGEAWK